MNRRGYERPPPFAGKSVATDFTSGPSRFASGISRRGLQSGSWGIVLERTDERNAERLKSRASARLKTIPINFPPTAFTCLVAF